MKSILLFSLAAILIVSCSSTNNFDRYNIKNSKFLFEEKVDGNINTVGVYLEQKHDKMPKDSGFVKILSSAMEVINIAGEIVATSLVESKLNEATNPQKLANQVGNEVESQLQKFCRIESTRNINDEYDYIATTYLNDVHINSTSGFMYLHMKLTTKIESRKTGEIVWENSENAHKQLRYDSSIGLTSKSNISRLTSNALQLIDLVTLTDDQIRNSINNAVNEISKDMSEELMDDLRPFLR